jgi:hypothetical protein
LVAGRNRVPKPATGKTALRMRLVINLLEAMCRTSLNPLQRHAHDKTGCAVGR